MSAPTYDRPIRGSSGSPTFCASRVNRCSQLQARNYTAVSSQEVQMEPCRYAIRERHQCVDSQGRPVHGEQVCFYESKAQLCDQRARESLARRPLALAGKDRAVGS